MFAGFGGCPRLVSPFSSFVFCCGFLVLAGLTLSRCCGLAAFSFGMQSFVVQLGGVVYERKYMVVVCRDFVYIVFRRWFSLFVRTLPTYCRCSFRVVVSLSWFFGARTFCLVGLRMTLHYKFFEFVSKSSFIVIICVVAVVSFFWLGSLACRLRGLVGWLIVVLRLFEFTAEFAIFIGGLLVIWYISVSRCTWYPVSAIPCGMSDLATNLAY